MHIDPSLTSYSSMLSGKTASPQTVPQTGQKSKAAMEAEENIARIREVGFRQWAEEENDRKLEELREKILQSMGLTEESLKELPGNRRAAIENMIRNEIQKQLAATSQMNGPKTDKTGRETNSDAMNALRAIDINSRLGLDLLDGGTRLFAQESGTGEASDRTSPDEDRRKGGLFE